jgi:hypothetical protein
MNYSLRRSARARHLRMEVRPLEGVVVVAPESATEVAIARFARRHGAWAVRKMEGMRTLKVISVAHADIPVQKRRARVLAEEACHRWAAHYGVSVGRIRIGAQTRRWGSCSHRGDLSFNFKIALLPAPLAEYVIVHEVCHLLEFNHSRAFWAHIARAIPDFKARREALRRTAFVFTRGVHMRAIAQS